MGADMEDRVRALEIELTKLKAEMAPLLTLAPTMTALSGQITDLRLAIGNLKTQASVIAGIAAVVAPFVFGLVSKFLK